MVVDFRLVDDLHALGLAVVERFCQVFGFLACFSLLLRFEELAVVRGGGCFGTALGRGTQPLALEGLVCLWSPDLMALDAPAALNVVLVLEVLVNHLFVVVPPLLVLGVVFESSVLLSLLQLHRQGEFASSFRSSEALDSQLASLGLLHFWTLNDGRGEEVLVSFLKRLLSRLELGVFFIFKQVLPVVGVVIGQVGFFENVSLLHFILHLLNFVLSRCKLLFGLLFLRFTEQFLAELLPEVLRLPDSTSDLVAQALELLVVNLVVLLLLLLRASLCSESLDHRHLAADRPNAHGRSSWSLRLLFGHGDAR